MARRINAAAGLLDSGLNLPRALQDISRRYRLSGRQARRYVERARDGGPIEIPPAKAVFTVNLPRGLLRRLRQSARARGWTLSALVAAAVEDLLDRIRSGRRGGR